MRPEGETGGGKQNAHADYSKRPFHPAIPYAFVPTFAMLKVIFPFLPSSH